MGNAGANPFYVLPLRRSFVSVFFGIDMVYMNNPDPYPVAI